MTLLNQVSYILFEKAIDSDLTTILIRGIKRIKSGRETAKMRNLNFKQLSLSQHYIRMYQHRKIQLLSRTYIPVFAVLLTVSGPTSPVSGPRGMQKSEWTSHVGPVKAMVMHPIRFTLGRHYCKAQQ